MVFILEMWVIFILVAIQKLEHRFLHIHTFIEATGGQKHMLYASDCRLQVWENLVHKIFKIRKLDALSFYYWFLKCKRPAIQIARLKSSFWVKNWIIFILEAYFWALWGVNKDPPKSEIAATL